MNGNNVQQRITNNFGTEYLIPAGFHIVEVPVDLMGYPRDAVEADADERVRLLLREGAL